MFLLTALVALWLALLFTTVEAAASSSSQGSAEPKLTPCQREKKIHDGRYETAIAEEFPPLGSGRPSVISNTAARNIFCECVASSKMKCHIICVSFEMQEECNARLDPPFAEMLLPFIRNSMLTGNRNPIFVHKRVVPSIIAEIIVHPVGEVPVLTGFIEPLANLAMHPNEPQVQIKRSASYPFPGSASLLKYENSSPRSVSPSSLSPVSGSMLTRQSSSPGRLQYPTRYVSMRICNSEDSDGLSCPITHDAFTPGQVVYILKTDADKVRSGKSVCCISAEGLMALKKRAFNEKQEGFRDIMRRTGDRLLTIRDDYDAYVLTENDDSTAEPKSNNGAGSSTDRTTEVLVSYSHLPFKDCTLLILFLFTIFFVLLCSIFTFQKHLKEFRKPLL